MNLTYKANVYQNTGQDWNDVKVTLSTSDPNTNNIKPNLNPKYLNFISKYSNYKSNTATKNYNYKYNPYIKTVSGTVTDESGLPLLGASVIVKGTTNGTTTDFDGNYSIKINEGDALEFSYVGYKSELIPIHSSTINLSLFPDNQLEEVVIVAYSMKQTNAYTNAKANSNKVREMMDREEFDDEPYEDPYVYTSTGDIIEEGITNTQFEIQKKHSIQSNGDLTVIKINDINVPQTFRIMLHQ